MRSDEPIDDPIGRELELVLASASFANAPQLSRFLRFVTERARAGRGAELKEYLLGIEVFHKDDTFDPRIDTIVRTEARRLRHKLAEYYQNQGRGDPVQIELPKGSYCPVFSVRTPQAEPAAGVDRAAVSRRRPVLAAGAIAATVAAVAGLWILLGSRTPAVPSIAILPLENLSGDADQEYFSDGMTDAIITDLAKIEGLRVISRTSVLSYKRSKQTVREIASQLQVAYVLEGTVTRSADRVRLTAQLIDARDDRHVWAESYERPRGDTLELQGELARAIAQQVHARMTPQEQARLAARPVDPDALDAYLQGRFNWHTRDEARVKKSIEWFQTAVARQPDYALAYAGLADAYSVQAGAADGPARHELEEKSCAAASRAVALNDRLGEAHASVAGCADTWNWSEREREFRKAIDLSPGSSTAHQWYGALLTKTGRVAEGVAEERQAVQLDPLAPSSRNQLGWALYMARQYPAAIEQHRGNVGVFPWYTQGYANLGISYAAAGRYADGIEVLEQGVRMAGAAPPLLALRAHVRTLQGDAADARRLVGDWASRGDVTPIAVALLYSDLGDADHAFAWLERGVTERSMFIDELKVEPMFDRLRDDPRFPALLRRMHLAN